MNKKDLNLQQSLHNFTSEFPTKLITKNARPLAVAKCIQLAKFFVDKNDSLLDLTFSYKCFQLPPKTKKPCINNEREY